MSYHALSLRSCLVGCITVLALMLPTTSMAQSTAQVADTSGAREMVGRFVAAFNTHDASAVAGLFAEDATLVNPFGAWWQGRAAIESGQSAAQETMFRNAALTADTTDIRFLSPGVAVAHFQWSMTGVMMQPGQPSADNRSAKPWRGITMFVMTNSSGQWAIQSGQVTPMAEGMLTAPAQPQQR